LIHYGATIYQGNSQGDDAWMLELPGSACAYLGPELWPLLRDLRAAGGACTRLDVRRDLQGEGIDLIERCIASCERLELCRVRRFAPIYERDAATGRLTGHGVYLGSRASEQFIRVYDKGLEQGGPEFPAGHWVRFESQLRRDRAELAAVELIDRATPETWRERAGAILCGVVDFREVTGDPNLERRPRCRWWMEFIAGFGSCRPEQGRRRVQLEDRVSWLERAVVPSLQATAELLGPEWTPGQVLDVICTRRRFPEHARKDPVVLQAVDLIRELERASFGP
jgi:hypothetical protein